MRRRLPLVRRIAGLLAALALVTLLASFGVSAVLTRDAALVQRVEPSAGAAALFGGNEGPGTPVGSPQLMVIKDEKAFLPGTGAGGVRYVNDLYLREQGVYPLQVKTVHFMRNLVAASSAGALLLLTALWLWARRRTA